MKSAGFQELYKKTFASSSLRFLFFFKSYDVFSRPCRLQFDMLEMDRLERTLVNLPLLQDASSYIPDTVDLAEDAPAREYWLSCFEEALDGVGGGGESENRTLTDRKEQNDEIIMNFTSE